MTPERKAKSSQVGQGVVCVLQGTEKTGEEGGFCTEQLRRSCDLNKICVGGGG